MYIMKAGTPRILFAGDRTFDNVSDIAIGLLMDLVCLWILVAYGFCASPILAL